MVYPVLLLCTRSTVDNVLKKASFKINDHKPLLSNAIQIYNGLKTHLSLPLQKINKPEGQVYKWSFLKG